jgi:hypothetical protein
MYVEKKRWERESSKREEQEYQALNNCLNEYSHNRNRFQRSVMISHMCRKKEKRFISLYIY